MSVKDNEVHDNDGMFESSDMPVKHDHINHNEDNSEISDMSVEDEDIQMLDTSNNDGEDTTVAKAGGNDSNDSSKMSSDDIAYDPSLHQSSNNDMEIDGHGTVVINLETPPLYGKAHQLLCAEMTRMKTMPCRTWTT